MGYEPITLGVQRHVWQKAKAGAPPAFVRDVHALDVRSEIFERDDHTCRCCGFQSRKYQEIGFANGNFRDTRSDNLLTLCIFCAQCFRLDRAGQMRSGVLIWLPEIGQAALHHIARAIYVGRTIQGPMADSARAAHEVLLSRREEARQRLGTDDPIVVGSVMHDFLEERDYRQRAKKLDGIRLLPLDRRIIREGDMEFNQFPQILAYWRSKDGPFGPTPPPSWAELFLSVTDGIR